MSLYELYNKLMQGVQQASKVMGMNRRNLGYVYPNNPRRYFAYANDKLLTKRTLAKAGLNIPKTYLSVSYFYELQKVESKLCQLNSFVIKPASGSGGNGIVVIVDYQDDKWISISGKVYTFEMIKKHIADTIFGIFSFGINDTAIIEERVIQDEHITKLSPQGLADIRMINYKGENVKAMLRIATEASDGKANLHQGGIGLAIDLKSGKSFSAQIQRENVTHHPDSGEPLLDIQIPYWQELSTLCEAVAEIIPMGYLGIDIAISEKGPIILEVNARPGIEIQNISDEGMIDILESIDRRVRCVS